jgi:hypothetical protein
MNFLAYIEQIGYPIIMLDEVVKKKSKYIYYFKFKGRWQIAPKWELKILQKILKDYLTKFYASNHISDNATAYIKNKNISYNLDRHQGNSYFFVTDFNNFFPSMTEKDIIMILKNILSNEDEKSFEYIKEIVFFRNKLQYGFPTSPIISNLVLKKFDTELMNGLVSNFANYLIQYTRYSDDITISSKYKIPKSDLKNFIFTLIDDYPFLSINHKKTRFFEKYSNKPHITGLIPLSKRNTIGKKQYNKIKVNIYLILKKQNIANQKYFNNLTSLKSYLNYLYLVDKHNYNRLKTSFQNFKDLPDYNELFKK